jgi:hypothetical protein
LAFQVKEKMEVLGFQRSLNAYSFTVMLTIFSLNSSIAAHQPPCLEADGFDLCFQAAINRKIVGGEFHPGLLLWPDEGDVFGCHAGLKHQLIQFVVLNSSRIGIAEGN